jgi:hypothetical protein
MQGAAHCSGVKRMHPQLHIKVKALLRIWQGVEWCGPRILSSSLNLLSGTTVCVSTTLCFVPDAGES